MPKPETCIFFFLPVSIQRHAVRVIKATGKLSDAERDLILMEACFLILCWELSLINQNGEKPCE